MKIFYVSRKDCECGLLAFIGSWKHSTLTKYVSDRDSGIVLHRSLSMQVTDSGLSADRLGMLYFVRIRFIACSFHCGGFVLLVMQNRHISL